MRAAVRTSIGNVRKMNEDSYIFNHHGLFVVADGMGGHVAGEVASAMATQTIADFMDKHHNELPTDGAHIIRMAIEEANRTIFSVAQQRNECLGMGTTVTAFYLAAGTAFWAHVGDSRFYILHNGVLKQITEDHSVVWELYRNGSISREEVDTHPHRNMLTRAVGTSDTIQVDQGQCRVDSSDQLLLCSDGLTGMLSDSEIQTIMMQESDVNRTADRLIEGSLARGGLDNVTVILLQEDSDGI